MSFLDHPLMRKYFGCAHVQPYYNSCGGDCNAEMADRILQAMQEPIKEGDRVIYVSSTGHVSEDIAKTDGSGESFHPYALCVKGPR